MSLVDSVCSRVFSFMVFANGVSTLHLWCHFIYGDFGDPLAWRSFRSRLWIDRHGHTQLAASMTLNGQTATRVSFRMNSIGCPSCQNLNLVTRAIGPSIAHCVDIENTSQIVQLARELGEKRVCFKLLVMVNMIEMCKPRTRTT
jgi:hypothetical protein